MGGILPKRGEVDGAYAQKYLTLLGDFSSRFVGALHLLR